MVVLVQAIWTVKVPGQSWTTEQQSPEAQQKPLPQWPDAHPPSTVQRWPLSILQAPAVQVPWPLHGSAHVPVQPSDWPPHLPVQLGVQPQTFCVPPPPQVWGEVQVPQLYVLEVPQLSLAVTLSQFLPSLVQNVGPVSGVQPQTFVVPPPPQVCGVLHEPQLTVREDPQLSLAVTLLQFLFRRVQNAVFPS